MSLAGGFTFLELLVVMSIAALVTAFVIPGLRDFVRGNSVSAAGNQMVSILNFAKTQALTQRQYAMVCRSGNYASYGPNSTGTLANACDTSTGSTSNDGYEDGVLIWVTTNSTETYPSSLSEIVKAQAVDQTGSITIRGDGGTSGVKNLVVFRSTGTLVTQGNLVVCSAKDANGSGTWNNGGANSTVIQMALGGRVQSVPGNAQGTASNLTSCQP